MRNRHVWKTKTEEGRKREVRAEKFGKKWRLQSQCAGDGFWTYHEVAELEDLLALHEVLWRKYQRKHLSWEDVAGVEELIRDAGGEVPQHG